jgi:hypothetical protein
MPDGWFAAQTGSTVPEVRDVPEVPEIRITVYNS